MPEGEELGHAEAVEEVLQATEKQLVGAEASKTPGTEAVDAAAELTEAEAEMEMLADALRTAEREAGADEVHDATNPSFSTL